MYFFYMASFVFLTAVAGLFSFEQLSLQDRAQRQEMRLETDFSEQERMTRILRRHLALHPEDFPAVAPGAFSEIPRDVIAPLARGGFLDHARSRYFLSDTGDIYAVVAEGIHAPDVVDMDAGVAVSGPPGRRSEFLQRVYGDNLARTEPDIADQITLLSHQDPAVADPGTEEVPAPADPIAGADPAPGDPAAAGQG